MRHHPPRQGHCRHSKFAAAGLRSQVSPHRLWPDVAIICTRPRNSLQVRLQGFAGDVCDDFNCDYCGNRQQVGLHGGPEGAHPLVIGKLVRVPMWAAVELSSFSSFAD